jgi:membrane fusion protein (multidrug efflux system)
MKNLREFKSHFRVFSKNSPQFLNELIAIARKISFKKPSRNLIISSLVALLSIILIYWLAFGRYIESTDDAYLKGDIIQISPKVSGYVVAVNFEENQRVDAGDVLVKIDDQDFTPRLDENAADLSISEENLGKALRQAKIQHLMVNKSQEAVKSAKAELVKLESEFKRAQSLFLEQAFSKEKLENVTADLVKTKAAFSQAKSDYEANLEQLEIVLAEVKSYQNRIKQSRARFELSKNDVDNTIIQSPTSGFIGNKAISVGSYVRAGSQLFSIVAADSVYVEANFKETQLHKMKKNQDVEITIDALASHKFHGKIVSFSPASGAVFSLLPPENATGNFTKIIQRVPVRIAIDKNDPLFSKLIPGFSAMVKVKTD